MYDRDRRDEDEETFEIDPHELAKDKRAKRIKGKKQDKKQDKMSDGVGKKPKKQKPKKQKVNRRHEKEALRDIMRDY